MSLDTVFDVSPSCLLAFPMPFSTDWTSRSGRVIPRTFLRRCRPLRITPPTTPAAAAPTATPGAPALLAAVLSVPRTPLAPADCEGALRLDDEPPLRAGLRPFPREAPPRVDREAVLRLVRKAALRLEREAALRLEREAALRLEREAALRLERVPPLWLRPLAFVFEPAEPALPEPALPPLAELLLLFALREVAFVAIPHPSQSRTFL